MRVTGARVFGANGRFERRDLFLRDGHFVSAEDDASSSVVDASGLMAIPGLVDVHSHGAMGQDFCNASEQALRTQTAYEASQGVLALCPTTMTFPEERIASTADAAAAWVASGPHAGCADVVGLNMEGPFISPQKVGAQNPAYVQAPDVSLFRRLQERSGGLFKLVTLAPEVEGALTFVDELSREVCVSVGHTCATYDQAATAFARGARHCTHLWNAMTPLQHRDPGVIGAAAERDDVTVELICDGVHIHPAAIRLTFELFAGRVVMISDSMEAAGLDDGTYELGGQEVRVRDRRATLADGTIAGSATNLFDCLRYAVLEAQVPLESALVACTLAPARAIGVDESHGSIEPGKVANLVLVDDDLRIRDIFLRGERIS